MMKPFLTIQGKPIYFSEDWNAGIGGGLWSTGLCLSKYLDSSHARASLERLYEKKNRRKLTLLELGSGNGLLAVCWIALGCDLIEEVVVSDIGEEHLELMRQTIRANEHLLKDSTCRVHVCPHRWGVLDNENDPSASLQSRQSFDLIVGSDVAYRAELYNPLIASLDHLCTENTVSIIGVTMMDTKPEFFHLLRRAGFRYKRFADHLLDTKFRGTIFGIFTLQRASRMK